MKEVFSRDKADNFSRKADSFWDKRGQVNKRTSVGFQLCNTLCLTLPNSSRGCSSLKGFCRLRNGLFFIIGSLLTRDVSPWQTSDYFPSTCRLGLQARLQARGMDAVSASHLAIVDVNLIQRQAYSLALQDGYRFTFFMLIPAILAVLFVRNQRVTRTSETQGEPTAEGGLHAVLHPV